MAEPAILFVCHVCRRMESLPLDTLQLVGAAPWLNANGWRAHRGLPRRTLCEPCWDANPRAPSGQVETVRGRPITERDR